VCQKTRPAHSRATLFVFRASSTSVNTRAKNAAVDPELVARARSGDGPAREALYLALSSTVYTLARRMLASSSLAEDVLQETFIEVFTKLDGLREDGEFRAWTKRIAVNKCLMHVRSSWVSRRVDWDDDAIGAHGAASMRPTENPVLARALDALPDLPRTVVWLHDVEGYTHREIAETMGKTTSFSKSQLARAHERLRELLGRQFADNGVELCAPVL
jgi:RNA polymerase sigma factor (sigma-70 family)